MIRKLLFVFVVALLLMVGWPLADSAQADTAYPPPHDEGESGIWIPVFPAATPTPPEAGDPYPGPVVEVTAQITKPIKRLVRPAPGVLVKKLWH